jgi:hypothetical protein
MGRCRASCIADGSWGIVSRMSGLMFDKEGIVVAVAEGGMRGEVRESGRIANTGGGLGSPDAQARRRGRRAAVLL